MYGCKECGATAVRWSGRCLACGAMNSLAALSAAEARSVTQAASRDPVAPLAVEAVDGPAPAQRARLATGIGELDRVLGGGFAEGASVVLGGEPGIGKSTILAQACGGVGRSQPVLYITAEEATAQVRARMERLGVATSGVKLAGTGDARAVAAAVASGDYRLAVVDSIQLLSHDGSEGEAGGPSQIRACAALIVEAARKGGCAVVLVGHVTKDGGLAGPRLLEHLVDTVLAFEGDRYADLRTLRAVKNRFGSTGEIGLFRMGPTGLEEVADPTGFLIADRDPEVPGSCIAPLIEGNRCLLVEIQALVQTTGAPQPVRRVAGLDPNRVAMVLACLGRHLRLPLGGMDVYVNATGGVRVQEPAADLAVALAVCSSLRETAIPPDLVAIGEVGLGGELRPAPRYELRAAEARRLGFKRLLGPGAGQGKGRLHARRLADAVREVWGG